MNWADYVNFSEEEFVCKCGCGRVDMHPEFMRRLQMIRTDMYSLMIVSSGYRCPDHNEAVSSSGSRDGPHTTGRAADILTCGERAFHMVSLALQHGMTGIGIHQKGPMSKRFIHMDLLTGAVHRPRIWSY